MSAPVEIIPAILPHTFAALDEALGRVAGAAPLVQVDIVDGRFARGATWPYKDHKGAGSLAMQEEMGLPHWEALNFEFDLMVEDPAAVVEEYVKLGAARLVVHAASPTAPRALELLSRVNDRDDGAAVVGVGVAVGLGEPLDALLDFNDQFDFVQVMGIAHIGKQGEPLDERARTMLERLRRRYPHMQLQVDGGVRLENARALAQAGATRLVCGSAIMGADDPRAAYDALVAEANSR